MPRLSRRVPAAAHDRVVAIGGDGTVQEVVNGLLDASEPPSLGIVPLGSGNDLARSLGLPDAVPAAWEVAVGDDTRSPGRRPRAQRRSDGALVASAGGIGFDAQVAAAMVGRVGWQAGPAGYLFTTLSELRRFSNRRVSLTIDGFTSAHDILFIAIANGAYYGGGMRIAPDARPDDGLLDVCVVGDISRLTALRQRRTCIAARTCATDR